MLFPCLAGYREWKAEGHRLLALMTAAWPAGYSHLTGGYPGGQAQYARVPFGALCLAFPRMPHIMQCTCLLSQLVRKLYWQQPHMQRAQSEHAAVSALQS